MDASLCYNYATSWSAKNSNWIKLKVGQTGPMAVLFGPPYMI